MEFISICEKDIQGDNFTPLNVVFTLVYSNKGYLLVQNRQSNFWELPSGSTKLHEKLRDCAIRRCRETSGQKVIELEFMGICKIIFENRSQSEYFAIYVTELEEEEQFIGNEEIKDMKWYKPGDDIKPICTTCSNIIQFYESECSKVEIQ
ncbi:NUDIX hydrolase [Oceanirhabdus sp. W0125-5]|uniref:NUDIX hydrolase n=1 Tax=Oceanirhabdus sp. W0125-5 TaxID=2999116 RepID=UPI0022F2C0B8|nr:NUDIX hydrolase [Oceanirhabdus sp. W0125-5]WBW97047.1 NUDIX hydrolase [Oceanirhabdus sp. W0125-5]